MMRRTRSQMKIDFPTQKSSRVPSKLILEDDTPEKGRRRLSKRGSKANLKPSSVLPTTPEITASPSKRRLQSRDDTENCSPAKKRNTSGDPPAVPSPLARLPLSPRRNLNEWAAKAVSPLKALLHSKMSTEQIPSPKRVRALTFSPDRKTCFTPDPTNVKPMKNARALTFSPVKSLPLPKTMPVTPTKFTALRGCESPVKSMQSPVRNAGLLSPVRNSGLMSPIRNSGILSPVKQFASPRKCASPLKRLTMDSPKKSGSPVKRKGIDSPRKLGLKSPPLRLVRQEGACYQKAKQALHTALPERLLCREKEYKEVNDFVDHHLASVSAGSMYISGAPGTGKTAVLSKTMQRIQEEKKTQIIYINCMSFKNSAAIYNRVLGELEGKETRHSTKDAMKRLEKAFSAVKSMVVLILDEVDQLDSKNQEVLYTMFEWPALPKSKLILIGIANALDLTDRILPRLQSRPKCKPRLMNFTPYSKDQLVAVLKDRLARVEVGGEAVMEPAAIQFCARKVAAQAGDMRKALDVCRRAVEMVEADVRKQQLLQATRSPSKKPLQKKIGVGHILKIVNEVYGQRVSVQSGEPQTVPLQQKLAICTLLLMIKNGKHKEIPLGKLHEVFCKVCRQQNVASIDQAEFHSLLGLLEARGITALKKAKDTRNVKVTLKLDERELETAMQDKTLMSAVLSKGLPT